MSEEDKKNAKKQSENSVITDEVAEYLQTLVQKKYRQLFKNFSYEDTFLIKKLTVNYQMTYCKHISS